MSPECIPAEVEQRAAVLGDGVAEPGQEVELGHGPGLVGLHVLQVKTANQEVIAPDVFGNQVHLQQTHKAFRLTLFMKSYCSVWISSFFLFIILIITNDNS